VTHETIRRLCRKEDHCGEAGGVQKPLDRPIHADFVLYNDYALFVCLTRVEFLTKQLCCLSIIDAIMYLLNSLAARGHELDAFRAVRPPVIPRRPNGSALLFRGLSRSSKEWFSYRLVSWLVVCFRDSATTDVSGHRVAPALESTSGIHPDLHCSLSLCPPSLSWDAKLGTAFARMAMGDDVRG
jgi:hypothetical protein